MTAARLIGQPAQRTEDLRLLREEIEAGVTGEIDEQALADAVKAGQVAGVKTTHVPYKGSGPALNDLLGGHVGLYIGSMPALLAQAKTGRLRALAVTGPARR